MRKIKFRAWAKKWMVENKKEQPYITSSDLGRIYQMCEAYRDHCRDEWIKETNQIAMVKPVSDRWWE